MVNRPESVVKELIENSLDAGANEITLIIKDAGKTLIQVIDNGSGMSPEDAEICFLRHSTSKISTGEDLENILTFGFRGEALASISAVAQVEIKTRTQDDELGVYIRIEDNNILEKVPLTCDKGTSVAVKNLFFNTPARRNFLKSDQTEFKHIYDTFVRMAISHPEIKFVFYNNTELLHNLQKAELITRLNEILSPTVVNNLIPFTKSTPYINISGFISKPGFVKKIRQEQFIFLNRRYIVNKNLNFAVYSAYDDLIEKGNYPSFILFLEIDPHRIDINVHPSKLEVKFEEEGVVFGFVKSAVREALKSTDLTFNVGFDKNIANIHTLEHKTPETTRQEKEPAEFSYESISPRKPAESHFKPSNWDELFTARQKKDEEESYKIEFQHKRSEEYFHIWQFNNKYLFCQLENGIMVVDQHAAHERILYEKYLKLIDSQAVITQQLLLPVVVKLSKIDFQLLLSLKKEFENIGFRLNFLNDEEVEIIGVPPDLKSGLEPTILEELLAQYKEYEMKFNLEKRDNIAKSFACKNAIKTGDPLKPQEMLNLIDELFLCETPYVCPHGRPTATIIKTEELDKIFARGM